MNEFNIPATWALIKFGNLFNAQKGKKPVKLYPEDSKNLIPYVDIQAFINGQGVQFAKTEESRIVENDDVVIVWDGSRSGLVGKAIYGALGSTLGRFPKNESIESDYLFYFLKSKYKLLNDNTKGSGIPHLNPDFLYKLNFPIPAIDEQKRIVQKIKSCFEKIELIQENFNKIEIAFDKLAISFLLESGKWLEALPIALLTDERNERICQKDPKCRKIGVDNELGVTDLRTTGKQDFSNYKIVKKGDILYNPMRVNVGSIALYDEDDEAITSPDYIVFSTKSNISKWLIFKFLKSNYGVDEISKKLTGSVRERLYYKKLKEIKFPNPSIERHKVAEKLLEVINIDLISRRYILNEVVYKLKESLFKNAFSGQLVEQIPSEGTGHDLLAKILSEKAATQKAEPNKKTKKTAKKAVTKSKKVTKKNRKK